MIEYSDTLQLHIYYNLFTSCTNKELLKEHALYTIFTDKFKALIEPTGNSNLKGFMLYLQHTLLPKREFSLLQKQTNQDIINLRFFDLFFFMHDLLDTNSRSITKIRIEKQKAYITATKAYENTIKLRYGHIWFAEIVDIFNFYGSKGETKFLANALVMNDLTFTSLFDELYLALLKIRAQINAPVLNAKRFLWKYLMTCNTKINDKNFFSPSNRVFEGTEAFITSKSKEDDSCVIEKTKLRTIIYLVFAWMKDDASIVKEFIEYETSLATNKNFSAGLSEVINFFSTQKSLMSEPFENFCSSEKGKEVLICISVGMARGIREYIRTGYNDEKEFLRHIEKYLTLYKNTKDQTKSVLRVMILETIYTLRNHYSKTDDIKAASIDRMLSNTKIQNEDWNSLIKFTDKGELAQFYVSFTRTEEPKKEFKALVDEYMKDENFKIGYVYGKDGQQDRQLGSVIEFILRYGSVESVKALIEKFNAEEYQNLFFYHVSGPSSIETSLIKENQFDYKTFNKIVEDKSKLRVKSYESIHLKKTNIINLEEVSKNLEIRTNTNALNADLSAKPKTISETGKQENNVAGKPGLNTNVVANINTKKAVRRHILI